MKNKKRQNQPFRCIIPVRIFVVVLLLIGIVAARPARADQYDQQIQNLQQQNGQAQGSLSQLMQEAGSYQDAIDKLQSQADQIKQQISDNQSKQDALNQQIQKVQSDLAAQRQILGQIVRTMYVDSEPTPLEELATSKNLSDYVDKQTYRAAVQQKIQVLLQQIKQLRDTLTAQKSQVDKLLQDEHNQQAQLSAYQNQQAQLLFYNQTQQASYSQQLQTNNARIVELRTEQARYISRYQIGGTTAGNPNHGGYPDAWNNAPQDSILDSWGMFNRECVSYTAFKVHQDYLAGRDSHDMPYWGGVGDAKDWPGNARAAGIPVDSNPAVGSIAISTAGTWGHSMYVEKVGSMNGQSAIYVSQYNTDFTGHYSEGWRYTTGLVFIHF